VFIGHCFGGLVIQKVGPSLGYEDIKANNARPIVWRGVILMIGPASPYQQQEWSSWARPIMGQAQLPPKV